MFVVKAARTIASKMAVTFGVFRINIKRIVIFEEILYNGRLEKCALKKHTHLKRSPWPVGQRLWFYALCRIESGRGACANISEVTVVT
jgi:hypothetical protein